MEIFIALGILTAIITIINRCMRWQRKRKRIAKDAKTVLTRPDGDVVIMKRILYILINQPELLTSENGYISCEQHKLKIYTDRGEYWSCRPPIHITREEEDKLDTAVGIFYDRLRTDNYNKDIAKEKLAMEQTLASIQAVEKTYL